MSSVRSFVLYAFMYVVRCLRRSYFFSYFICSPLLDFVIPSVSSLFLYVGFSLFVRRDWGMSWVR